MDLANFSRLLLYVLGCGTISLELLRLVWHTLPPERREQRPTILQIRYRGDKGVLSVDTSLPGLQLHIRKSMTKYIAKDEWRDLELCGAARLAIVRLSKPSVHQDPGRPRRTREKLHVHTE